MRNLSGNEGDGEVEYRASRARKAFASSLAFVVSGLAMIGVQLAAVPSAHAERPTLQPPFVGGCREKDEDVTEKFNDWLANAVGVRIPVIPATQSGAKLPPNPKEACHPIRTKAAPHRSPIGAQRRLG